MNPRGPVEWVRSIAEKLPDATRKEILEACLKEGINAHTARTQISKFLVSRSTAAADAAKNDAWDAQDAQDAVGAVVHERPYDARRIAFTLSPMQWVWFYALVSDLTAEGKDFPMIRDLRDAFGPGFRDHELFAATTSVCGPSRPHRIALSRDELEMLLINWTIMGVLKYDREHGTRSEFEITRAEWDDFTAKLKGALNRLEGGGR
jgi:hypothetical protein